MLEHGSEVYNLGCQSCQTPLSIKSRADRDTDNIQLYVCTYTFLTVVDFELEKINCSSPLKFPVFELQIEFQIPLKKKSWVLFRFIFESVFGFCRLITIARTSHDFINKIYITYINLLILSRTVHVYRRTEKSS